MDYWIPKLTGEGEQWYITLIDRKELDRVEKISFSKQPDTFIRVRFYFEKLDESNEQMSKGTTEQHKNTALQQTNNGAKKQFTAMHGLGNSLNAPQLSPSLPRSGFTAVDWGGIIGNGSCGVGETVQ